MPVVPQEVVQEVVEVVVAPWRRLDAVECATPEWADWLDHRRLLAPIGNVPPAELEASYYQSTGQLPMAA